MQRMVAAIGVGTLLMFSGASSIEDSPRMDMPGFVIVWAADEVGDAPIVSDFVIDTVVGAGDNDLIAADGRTVVTGELTPVRGMTNRGEVFRIRRSDRGRIIVDASGDRILDVADVFDAFGFNGAATTELDTRRRRSEISSSFYVASNVAFAIDAAASVPADAPDPDALDNIRYRVRVTLSGTDDGVVFGAQAQFPHSAGAAGGVRANFRPLERLANTPNIFSGDQRTAAAPGSITEQSVRFDIEYRYRTENYDLSQGIISSEAVVIYTVFVP